MISTIVLMFIGPVIIIAGLAVAIILFSMLDAWLNG